MTTDSNSTDTGNTSANTPANGTHNEELKGAIFQNDKGGVETRPDYRGRVTVGGVEYRIAAWKKKSQRSGKTFLSLSLTAEAPPETEDSF